MEQTITEATLRESEYTLLLIDMPLQRNRVCALTRVKSSGYWTMDGSCSRKPLDREDLPLLRRVTPTESH